MVMPDHAVRAGFIAVVATAAAHNRSIKARKTEAQVGGVEALKNSGVRAAQDKLAAGLQHAPDFIDSRAALRRRDVLQHLYTSDVVEARVGEGQKWPVALMEIVLRDIAPRHLDCSLVDIDARQLELRKKLRRRAEEFAHVTAEVEQAGRRRVAPGTDPGEPAHWIQWHDPAADRIGVIVRKAPLQANRRQ